MSYACSSLPTPGISEGSQAPRSIIPVPALLHLLCQSCSRWSCKAREARPSSHTHLHLNHQTHKVMENSIKSIIKEKLGLLASIKTSCFSCSPKKISKIPLQKHARGFLLDFFFPLNIQNTFFHLPQQHRSRRIPAC